MNTQKEKMGEEFRKKFGNYDNGDSGFWIPDTTNHCDASVISWDAVEEFMLSQLDSYKESLRKRVEEKKRRFPTEPATYKDSDANVWREGYNDALDRVLSLLNEE